MLCVAPVTSAALWSSSAIVVTLHSQAPVARETRL